VVRTDANPTLGTARRNDTDWPLWLEAIAKELGMLKDLKTNIERKQGELMDFIVNLKDQKKDLKKNMKE
jgi:hypothetical protein